MGMMPPPSPAGPECCFKFGVNVSGAVRMHGTDLNDKGNYEGPLGDLGVTVLHQTMSQGISEPSDGLVEDGVPHTTTINSTPLPDKSHENPSFHYTSAHSSRSSSFNQSAAELILGLFREDTVANVELSHYAHEDLAVREVFILMDAKNPDSWVSKKLVRPELWDNDTRKVCTLNLIASLLVNNRVAKWFDRIYLHKTAAI